MWAALSVCSGLGSAIGCLCSEFSGNQACKPCLQLRASVLRAPHLATLEKPQHHHLYNIHLEAPNHRCLASRCCSPTHMAAMTESEDLLVGVPR